MQENNSWTEEVFRAAFHQFIPFSDKFLDDPDKKVGLSKSKAKFLRAVAKRIINDAKKGEIDPSFKVKAERMVTRINFARAERKFVKVKYLTEQTKKMEDLFLLFMPVAKVAANLAMGNDIQAIHDYASHTSYSHMGTLKKITKVILPLLATPLIPKSMLTVENATAIATGILGVALIRDAVVKIQSKIK